MKSYLIKNGYEGFEGKALKTTSGWYNLGNGTDNFDFSALPGGHRDHSNGVFYNAYFTGSWWAGSELSDNIANFIKLTYDKDDLMLDNAFKSYGYSVRCVKDEEQ